MGSANGGHLTAAAAIREQPAFLLSDEAMWFDNCMQSKATHGLQHRI